MPNAVGVSVEKLCVSEEATGLPEDVLVYTFSLLVDKPRQDANVGMDETATFGSRSQMRVF